MADAQPMPGDYPPADHVLRDIGLWSDPSSDPPIAGLPVQPAICGVTGACSAGALAVLLDVVAGVGALRAAEAGWVATSDLHLHWLRPVRSGDLVASTHALRSGRTSVVLEVNVELAGEPVAYGALGFARLEARGELQTRPRAERAGRFECGVPSSGFDRPWAQHMGVRIRDASAGVVELPVTPYVGNSLRGLQGGISVALLDFAAEAAGTALLGPGVATRDLAVHFVAIGRKGPLRTGVQLLRRDGGGALFRVESRDLGADGLLCVLGSARVEPFA